MSHYTLVNIVSRKKVIEEICKILEEEKDNIRYTTAFHEKAGYYKLFFEFDCLDDKRFFSDICEKFPDEKIVFESSVSYSFESFKYINKEGKLHIALHLDYFDYYDDDVLFSIEFPFYDKNIVDMKEEIDKLKRNEKKMKKDLNKALMLIKNFSNDGTKQTVDD